MCRSFERLIVILLVACAAHAADPEYVKLDFGNTYTLSLRKDGGVGVSVPVTPTVAIDTLQVEIADVLTGTDHDSTLRSSFTAKLQTPPNTTPELLITSPPLLPQTYTVTFAIYPKKTPAKRQLLKVQLTSRPATLRPITAQTFDIVRVDPFADKQSPQLILTETSRVSRLRGVEVRHVEPSLHDGSVVAATITSADTIEVPAGATRTIPLALQGDFPIGSVKTTVEVTSVDLPTALAVPIEVRTRLNPALLVVAILIGVAAGFLVRIGLKRAQESGSARVAAYDLLGKLHAERDAATDADFRNDVDAAIGIVTAAMNQRSAAPITTAITQAVDALAKAKSDLQVRLVAVLRSIEETAALTAIARDLPDTIATLLRNADGSLASVRAIASAGNARDADEQMKQLRNELATNIAEAGEEWRTVVRTALDATGDWLPLPPALAATLSTVVPSVHGSLDAIPITATPDSSAIIAAVYAAHQSVEHNFTRRIIEPLATYAETVVEVIGGTELPAAIAELRAAVTLDDSVAAASELLDAMTTAITNKTQRDLSALLNEGRYREAAEAAVSQTLLGKVGAADSTSTVVSPLAAPATPFLGARVVPIAIAGIRDAIAIGRSRAFFELLAAKLLQAVLVAVFVALGGYLILEPKFDGTWQGLFIAFFWGYAGDLTGDAILETAKKFR